MKTVVSRLISRTNIPSWLIVLVITLFVFRIPTLFEPLWYGDEAIYLTLGEGIRQGLSLYQDIHDNKPPLIYLLAALSGNIFWFKAILAFWTIAATILFWKLTKILFPKNKRLSKFSTFIFAFLTTVPLLEGNIANAELFILPLTLSSFILLFKDKLTSKKVFLAGIILGLGGLFKIPALVDAIVPIVVLFFLSIINNIPVRQRARDGFFLILGVATPFIGTFVFFGLAGTLEEYLKAVFVQTFDYLSLWRGAIQQQSFFARNGPLILRSVFGILTIAIFLVFYQKRKISSSFFIASVWLVSSLFASLLSERPYPHYLIQTVPALSLLLGSAITSKTKEQFFVYPILGIFASSLVLFKFWYYPVFPYYENFILWATNQRITSNYFDHFDSRVNRNYRLAQFLTTSAKESDRLFIWGNNPEIYALTHFLPPTRFVVAYHVQELNAYKEVINNLRAEPPKFIIVTITTANFPELEAFISKKYLAIELVDNANVYVRMDSLSKGKMKQ